MNDFIVHVVTKTDGVVNYYSSYVKTRKSLDSVKNDLELEISKARRNDCPLIFETEENVAYIDTDKIWEYGVERFR